MQEPINILTKEFKLNLPQLKIDNQELPYHYLISQSYFVEYYNISLRGKLFNLFIPKVLSSLNWSI